MINCWLPPWVREGNPGSHTAAHSRDYGCQEEVRHIHCAFIDFIEYRLHKIFFHVQIQVMEGGSLGEITPWQIFSCLSLTKKMQNKPLYIMIKKTT